jgi:starch synthase (maltosyl-transferring)
MPVPDRDTGYCPQFSETGCTRVVIEHVRPEIDGGLFPIKRVIGESVTVEADVFADGHDRLSCRLLHRHGSSADWCETPMVPLGNDRWRGEFRVEQLGTYHYTIEGWVEHFQTWLLDLAKRLEAGQNVDVEMLIGADLVEAAAGRAYGDDAEQLWAWASRLRQKTGLEEDLTRLVSRYPDRKHAGRYQADLRVCVDREKARFSTWYEVFPRSCAPEPGRHGTFCDVERWLPYIASLGFDTLYLPPIHPIGRAFRKGKNNSVVAEPGDTGSPWAIGSEEGGHKSIHPELGSFDDFQRLVAKASEHGLEIALDIAFQCSPDHPYVRQHPEWFRARPDGTIQYAENPPKKYQDIYPFDFDSPNWRELWTELHSVFLFWIGHGVRIFRVDNPHTKPFAFWEWALSDIKSRYPEVLFLSEAFTRPRVMERLAKLGFSQSYTYFAWRNTKDELTSYFRELTQTEVCEYLRPNLWPNTPDILTEYLQKGGRPSFAVRLALAATLGANYGIYGPAFELCENEPYGPGSEEYLHAEKYEIKHRDLTAAGSLKEFIGRVNQIRRANPALQSDRSLRFHPTDNPLLLCYSKTTGDLSNVILVAVNLDATFRQGGWVDLDLAALDLDPLQEFTVHDLLSGSRYPWRGSRNYIELTPNLAPAHIFRIAPKEA